jgi:hypothetical protein
MCRVPKKEITGPIKVAICHTKSGKDAECVYKCFEQGLIRNGDSAVHCFNSRDVQRTDADLFFMVSYPHLDPQNKPICDEYELWRPTEYRPGSDNAIRTYILEVAKRTNRRVLVLDTGLLKSTRNRKGDPDNYFQIGYDNIKGFGKYYTENCPDDRWKQLQIEILPWRKQKANNNILIFGQLRFGIGSQHVDIHKFYKHTMSYLTSQEKRIFYIEHPNVPQKFEHSKYRISYVWDRTNRFSAIDAAVGFSTNTIIESIVCGVPTIAMSRLSPAYNFCSNHIEDVNEIKTFDREQFLYNLAYTQWTPHEMSDGHPWNFLRKHSLKDYEGI